MVAGWSLLYVAVYPWGDLAAGIGFVAAGAMGAWLGARRGAPAVTGWALAGLLAGGATTHALAIALAQVATALVLGQLRDLRVTAVEDAYVPTALCDQLLRYARALLRPDRAEAFEVPDGARGPAIRTLDGGHVLIALLRIGGRTVELALEREVPFDADERAVLGLLLEPHAKPVRLPVRTAPAERVLLEVG
jgi:hypothetical protein